jgi:hypothetical protein
MAVARTTLNKQNGPYFASCIFVQSTSSFSLNAHLPVQDVLGDTQTRFYAAHYRLWLLLYTIWACDSHIWPSSMFFEKKMEWANGRKGKTKQAALFVLPGILPLFI